MKKEKLIEKIIELELEVRSIQNEIDNYPVAGTSSTIRILESKQNETKPLKKKIAKLKQLL